jgi:hypothetical protein
MAQWAGGAPSPRTREALRPDSRARPVCSDDELAVVRPTSLVLLGCHSPVWLTPYCACAGVKPSYSSCSVRLFREKDESFK